MCSGYVFIFILIASSWISFCFFLLTAISPFLWRQAIFRPMALPTTIIALASVAHIFLEHTTPNTLCWGLWHSILFAFCGFAFVTVKAEPSAAVCRPHFISTWRRLLTTSSTVSSSSGNEFMKKLRYIESEMGFPASVSFIRSASFLTCVLIFQHHHIGCVKSPLIKRLRCWPTYCHMWI